MTAFLSSLVVVALAEMGDKTQLIALTLGLRYRRPWTIMLGILVATAFNHALASALGAWGATRLPAPALKVLLGLSFVVFGVWTLFPDQAETPAERQRWGTLAATTVIFFLAEIGDKTQLATVALGARFESVFSVTAGTTIGMLAADGLAVFAGARFADYVPVTWFRRIAAALFFLFGAASIAAALGLTG
jgi:putative Ca2+/H+ antiporter (TMEM165/GDT1 family)